MSEFFVFFKLGLYHITDFGGYDHMLFLLALCGIYKIADYKILIGLITAFTVGHCITLVLAGLNLVNVNSSLIEFLIPLTIMATALINLWVIFFKVGYQIILKYFVTVFFGLIHGLGFSNYFKSLVGEGLTLIKTLLAFNIGIEIGQIFIVLIITLFGFILQKIWQFKYVFYQASISILAFIISLKLIV